MYVVENVRMEKLSELFGVHTTHKDILSYKNLLCLNVQTLTNTDQPLEVDLDSN